MTGLIPVGEIQAAGDLTTATLIRMPTATQREVDARVVPVATAVLAENPAVAAAAVLALNTVVDGLSIPLWAAAAAASDVAGAVTDDDRNASWLAWTASGGIPDFVRYLLAGATSRTFTSITQPTPPAGFGYFLWQQLDPTGSTIIDILEGVA